MQKKVLIISSDNTGHGHKSITESLSEKIGINSDDVKIHVVDGFSLGGKLLSLIGSYYGPITRTSENLWKMVWKLTAIKASLVNNFIELQIKRNFLQLIEEVEPDVILSVHPNFNGLILNILEKQKIKIPFLTLIADLVNIYPLWAGVCTSQFMEKIVEEISFRKHKDFHFPKKGLIKGNTFPI
ncbi:MGDG synthase family glycosyltransferase [Halobacillus litoralis]|uniref:MGDG synthase family glycosyltransferase n=1 Tax=Halobacillus litoralis TaxID=45668 RepID=UPI0024931F24|nr:hypothetical protein [Halobacillus litoralis]